MLETLSPVRTKQDQLLDLKSKHILPCVYHFYRDPPVIASAEDCHLIDTDGRRYLDCYAGVTVMNAGHCNPEIIEPAIDQIRTLQHTTTIYLTEPQLRLAGKLSTITPDGIDRFFFCASGSEAVEGAILLSRLHTKRRAVIAMDGGLHGRTRWAMSATGIDMWRTDTEPSRDFHHVPFGDIDALERALRAQRGQVAAVILEPIQGNGGIVVPGAGYLEAVRKLCSYSGALLILDEVQTGNRDEDWFEAVLYKLLQAAVVTVLRWVRCMNETDKFPISGLT